MAVSALASATRAFASVLLTLARAYGLQAGANRESKPEDLLRAYRRLLLKTHPDKGGKKADLQKLQAAKEKWDKARKANAAAGRPRAAGETALAKVAAEKRRKRKEFRVNALVVVARLAMALAIAPCVLEAAHVALPLPSAVPLLALWAVGGPFAVMRSERVLWSVRYWSGTVCYRV